MQAVKSFSLRVRILLAIVSIAGLFVMMQRIQAKAVAAAFDSIHWGWFFLALAAFGGVFVPAGLRWRVALQSAGSSIGTGAAGRISLIGHFFYTIFFGAVGGDTAKSLLYSRWHDVPLAKTLAASSLDRILGFAGLIVFVGVSLLIGIDQGGADRLGDASFKWPLWGVLVLAVVVGSVIFWLKRSSRESFQRLFVKTLGASIAALTKRPRQFLIGIACGVAVQAALSAVLIGCLAATTSGNVPWAEMAWTFPVITIISALPVTFAGLGVRDSAAVVLFGFYQISPSHAVAASLLAAAVSLTWAVAGAGLLWWEASRRDSRAEIKELMAIAPR